MDDFNLYVYVGSDSVNSVDPTGLSDLNLFSVADGLYASNQAMDLPGMYTITGHGSARELADQRPGGIRITTAAALLREMKGYVVGSGEPVFIGSCNVGNGVIPQDLANLIRAPVYAPDGYYFSPTTRPKEGEPYRPGGPVTLTANSLQNNEGQERSFNPFFPADQPESERLPLPSLSKVVSNPKTKDATIRIVRVTGRIDSSNLDEEDRLKLKGK